MLDLDNKITPKIAGVEADVTVHTSDIKALQVGGWWWWWGGGGG